MRRLISCGFPLFANVCPNLAGVRCFMILLYVILAFPGYTHFPFIDKTSDLILIKSVFTLMEQIFLKDFL